MKIGIYNPYLDSFGGGERYTLTLAGHWAKTHDVHVFWTTDKSILMKSETRFGIPLSNVHVVDNVFAMPLHRKLWQTSSYDLIFILSDGSIPTHAAKKGIIHFQAPFKGVNFPFWKRRNYQSVVCNSQFTEKFLDPSIPIPRTVIYPPVNTGGFHSGKKSKTILSVGRFNGHYDAKKQQILIDAFEKGVKQGIFTGFNFILAGSVLPSDEEYFEKLKKSAKGLPITFFSNCSYTKLIDLYAKAAIYWHAAGFGETDPTHMEHFGISTVEAMASGCIPVVFEGGGQPEIVTDGLNGYMWSTVDTLLSKTKKAMKSSKTLINNSKMRALDFSEQKFTDAFDTLLTTL